MNSIKTGQPIIQNNQKYKAVMESKKDNPENIKEEFEAYHKQEIQSFYSNHHHRIIPVHQVEEEKSENYKNLYDSKVFIYKNCTPSQKLISETLVEKLYDNNNYNNNHNKYFSDIY